MNSKQQCYYQGNIEIIEQLPDQDKKKTCIGKMKQQICDMKRESGTIADSIIQGKRECCQWVIQSGMESREVLPDILKVQLPDKRCQGNLFIIPAKETVK
jgi:hypothetical protein